MIRDILNSILHPITLRGGALFSAAPRRLSKRIALVAVGAVVAAPVSAASIVQTADFEADFVPFLETSVPIAIAIPSSKSDTYSDTDEATEVFNPFDTSLGMLTGVTWDFGIDATMQGDSLYGCVGVFSVGCKMETTLQFDVSAQIVATVKGEQIIKVPLPSGDVVEVRMPQQSIILPDSVSLSETEEPSPSGLVGCVVKEILQFEDGCLGGSYQEASNDQTITDDPLDAYTNGEIEVLFRGIAEGSIDTTCQLFGLFGSCYSRSFPEVTATFSASLTYEYTPFSDPVVVPPVPAPSPVPVPAGLPLLAGAVGMLSLVRRRAARGVET